VSSTTGRPSASARACIAPSVEGRVGGYEGRPARLIIGVVRRGLLRGESPPPGRTRPRHRRDEGCIVDRGAGADDDRHAGEGIADRQHVAEEAPFGKAPEEGPRQPARPRGRVQAAVGEERIVVEGPADQGRGLVVAVLAERHDPNGSVGHRGTLR